MTEGQPIAAHEVLYSPRKHPVRFQRDLAIAGPCEELPNVLRELHAITQERFGASTYLPSPDRTRTSCRFEWTHTSTPRPDFRIAIELDFCGTANSKCRCWVTPEFALSQEAADLSNIDPEVINAAFACAVATLDLAQCSGNWKTHHVPFWIEQGSQNLNPNHLSLAASKVTLSPSARLSTGKLGLQLLVAETSATQTGAALKASSAATLASQLITLLTQTPCPVERDTTIRLRRNSSWSPNPASNLESACITATEAAPSWCLADFPREFARLWTQRNLLSSSDRRIFDNALSAFFSARVAQDKERTMAMIGFVAALGALSASEQQKCPGKLACTECGALDHKHSLVGDKRAIRELVIRALEIEPSTDTAKRIGTIIGRVYDFHRSGFVHNAVTRFDDDERLAQSPVTLPLDSQPVSSVFTAQCDLETIAKLTARTLAWWLFKHTNHLDHVGFSPLTETEILGEIAIHAPSHVTVKVDEAGGLFLKSAADGPISASVTLLKW